MKGTTLGYYKKIKHLAIPVIRQSAAKTVFAIEKLIEEMDCRYKKGYESKPYIICVIEEFLDLSNLLDSEDHKRFIKNIEMLCRKGRECKILVILTTHDARGDEFGKKITGYMTTRLALKCGDIHQSIGIIGSTGAYYDLIGKGDMILKSTSYGIQRLQGSLVDKDTISDYIEKHNTDNPDYLFELPDESDDEEETEYLDVGELNQKLNVTTAERRRQRRIEEIQKYAADIIFYIFEGRINFAETLANSTIQNVFGIGYDKAEKCLKILRNS